MSWWHQDKGWISGQEADNWQVWRLERRALWPGQLWLWDSGVIQPWPAQQQKPDVKRRSVLMMMEFFLFNYNNTVQCETLCITPSICTVSQNSEWTRSLWQHGILLYIKRSRREWYLGFLVLFTQKSSRPIYCGPIWQANAREFWRHNVSLLTLSCSICTYKCTLSLCLSSHILESAIVVTDIAKKEIFRGLSTDQNSRERINEGADEFIARYVQY